MLDWIKPKSQTPKTLGQIGEERAQEEYKKLGYKILAKNEYNKKGKRLGEIDFIAANKEKIIFVEVKTRNILSAKFGSGEEAVNAFKQRKILAAVKMYFLRNPKLANLRPQIDVCIIEYSEVDPVRSQPPEAAAGAYRHRTSNRVDKNFKPARIIANAVEDWG